MSEMCKADKKSVWERRKERDRQRQSNLRREFKRGGEPERIQLKIPWRVLETDSVGESGVSFTSVGLNQEKRPSISRIFPSFLLSPGEHHYL